jgi:hypothetical protein
MLPVKVALPILIAAMANKAGFSPKDIKKIKPAVERELRKAKSGLQNYIAPAKEVWDKYAPTDPQGGPTKEDMEAFMRTMGIKK